MVDQKRLQDFDFDSDSAMAEAEAEAAAQTPNQLSEQGWSANKPASLWERLNSESISSEDGTIYRSKPVDFKPAAAMGSRMLGAAAGGVGGGMALGPLGIGIGASTGEELAKQFINQPLGLEPETSGIEDVGEFAGRTALNYVIPGSGSVWSAIRGIPNTGAAKEAARLAASKGLLKMGPEAVESAARLPKSVSPALEQMQRYAADPRRAIAAELGAHAGENTYEKAIAREFDENVDTLIQSGVFDSPKTAEDLLVSARKKAVEAAESRAEMIKQVDAAAGSKPVGTQMYSAKSGEAIPSEPMLSGSRTGVAAGSPNHIYVNELAPYYNDFNNKIQSLSISGLSEGMAKTLRDTSLLLGRDIERLNGASPREAMALLENLNNVRRNLLNEFSKQNIAREATGDIKQLADAGAIEVSVDAISQFQKALKDILGNKVEAIAKANGLPYSKEQFLSLTKQYGAFKSLEDISQKFINATERGLVSEPRRMTSVNPNLAAGINVANPLQAGRAAIGEGIGSWLGNKFSPVNQAALTNLRSTLERDQVPSQIRSILSLSKAPYSSTKLPRNVTSLKANAAKLAFTSQVMRKIGLIPMSAEAQFMDDGTELLKMPDKLLEQKLQMLSEFAPQLFDAPEGGYPSYFNGKLNHPMDKDAHMSAVLDADLPAAKRAQVLGPLLSQNKYVSIDTPTEAPPVQAPSMNLEGIGRALSDIPMSQGANGTFSASSETQRMIQMMNRSQGMIDAERSGL